MNRILAFGEILWDIIEGEAHLGGAPLNFAAHVHQCGLSSGIVSCLGNDDLGNRAMKEVERLGVKTDLILRRNKKTGTVKVEINEGQPDYEIFKQVAYDFIDLGRLDHKSIRAYNIFYFGTLAQRSDCSRESLYDILDQHSFDQIFYDVNLRKDSYTKEIIEKSLSRCSIFKSSDEEVTILSQMLFGDNLSFRDFAENVSNHYPNIKIVIITAGGKGSYVYQGGVLIEVPSDPIEVKDTVGAGDSFSAAFLTTFLRSNDAVKSVTIANHVGGFVASHHGAIPTYSDQIKDYLCV
jgi:fructokinase